MLFMKDCYSNFYYLLNKIYFILTKSLTNFVKLKEIQGGFYYEKARSNE